jgi:hypothetical protein
MKELNKYTMTRKRKIKIKKKQIKNEWKYKRILKMIIFKFYIWGRSELDI